MSRADWQVLCEVARRLESALGQSPSAGWDYAHPSQIWDEMRRLTPDFAGISYDRLDAEGGVHWPCPEPNHPGTPYLYAESFPRGRGRFWTLEYGSQSEQPDSEYPFLLSPGACSTTDMAGQ